MSILDDSRIESLRAGGHALGPPPAIPTLGLPNVNRGSQNRGFSIGKRAFSGPGPSRRCQNGEFYPRMARSSLGGLQNAKIKADWPRVRSGMVPRGSRNLRFSEENTYFPAWGLPGGARTATCTPEWPDLAPEMPKPANMRPDLPCIHSGMVPCTSRLPRFLAWNGHVANPVPCSMCWTSPGRGLAILMSVSPFWHLRRSPCEGNVQSP